MSRLTIVMAVTTVLLISAMGVATAPAEARSTKDTAIAIALNDELIRARIELRPHLIADAEPAATAGSNIWLVTLRDDDRVRMLVQVDVDDERVVRSSGQSLVVMPDERTILLNVITSPWMQLPALLLFSMCFGALRTRDARIALAPLLGIAVVSVILLLDVVPAARIRAGNALIYGGMTVLLIAGAVVWVRTARSIRASASTAPIIRGPAALWGTIAAIGIVIQAVWGAMIRIPIDVAFASDTGARLMQGGARVYGNTLELPGFLTHPDSYGPLAYLAYVPGVALFESPRNAVLFTNVAWSTLGAIALFLAGRRIAGNATGTWMAAAWTTCPFVLTGVSAGNNDIVIGCLVALAMASMHRPAWRAAALAAAGAVKYLPLVAALAMLRQRREPRRADLTTLAAGLGVLLVLFVIGVQDLDGARVFIDRAFTFQLGRDDIGSVWGLTGLSELRYVVLGIAVLLGASAALLVRRGSSAMAPACVAATIGLTLAALPHFWPSYVTWIVPAVLVLAVQVSDERS